MTHTSGHDDRNSDIRDAILKLLKQSPQTSLQLKEIHWRFSASIQSLRIRGHEISTSRGVDGVHIFTWTRFIERVRVTEEMELAYYLSPHWKVKRRQRLEFDHWCVHCKSIKRLEVHHWEYDLFNEGLEDLATYCESCHDWIHERQHVTTHFPHYVSAEIGARLTQLVDTRRKQSQ